MDGKELVLGAAYDVYMDIKKRTNGEIYFGVVGPVRTGKFYQKIYGIVCPSFYER